MKFIEIDGKLGVVNKTGKIMFFLPDEYRGYDYIKIEDKDFRVRDGLLKVALYMNSENDDDVIYNGKLSGKRGLIDKKGKVILPIKYESITYFESEDGHIDPELIKIGLDYKYGLLDERGKIILPAEYDHIKDFGDGLLEIELNRKYGLVDRTGKIVLPVKYNEIIGFYKDDKKKIVAILDGNSKIVEIERN